MVPAEGIYLDASTIFCSADHNRIDHSNIVQNPLDMSSMPAVTSLTSTCTRLDAPYDSCLHGFITSNFP